jgi:hypothetical protein
MNDLQQPTDSQPPVDLSILINQLMQAMLTDYPQQYRKSVRSKSEAMDFKKRIVSKLQEFNHMEQSPEFLPPLPKIVEQIKVLAKARRKAAREKVERARLAALPTASHFVNPIALLTAAKQKAHNGGNTDLETRKANLAELLQQHKAVLELPSHYAGIK